MIKRKRDQIGGNDPWDVEIASYVERGTDQDTARIATILRYMYHGDSSL
jgi:hypothetical protein